MGEETEVAEEAVQEVNPEGEGNEEASPADPVAVAVAEAAEYREHLQRVQAEFDNFRKRVQRERAELGAIATAGLIEQLLEVLDEFELALAAAESLGDEHSGVTKGIEAVYAKLFDTVRKQGLERIDETGVPFDANVHEAVSRAGDGPDEADLLIDEVFRPGYRIGERVIRPAMVRVGHSTGDGER